MARYFRRATTKIYFIPTLAQASAPTQAEARLGTDLSPQVAEISGFAFANSPIDVPDFVSAFVKNIPGEDKGEKSSITFYEDNVSNPFFTTTLAKGVSGYVALYPYGVTGTQPTTGNKVEIWPITVASTVRQWSAGNDAAKYMVDFTLSDVPYQNASIS